MDWLTLVLCLLLGILAEESFFRSQVGISYLVFLIGFYGVFFWRFRGFSFSHQRFGYLIICCIWLLAAGYFLNDNMFFNALNILVIPSLVIFHLILVTSPKQMQWTRLAFIPYLFSRLVDALKYTILFTAHSGKGLKGGVNDNKPVIWKKIMIGVVMAIPVLMIVLRLLISADTQFERLVGDIPNLFRVVDAESFIRLVLIFLFMVAFFGLMQALYQKQVKVFMQTSLQPAGKLDSIIINTVLVLINIVYVLFTIVQFTYFFSGKLQGDYTYAEYARKGFFELLFVTMINLTITVAVITFADRGRNLGKRMTQIMLTVLVIASSVMLCSAFLRLSMYEEAYGFTFTRVMSHSFMIFLAVIYSYTFTKIWIDKLSLFHFYFITTLIYYTAITVIDLDRIVVKENINRYEESGKLDVAYLNSLSSTGVLALIELYEEDKHLPGVRDLLVAKQQEAKEESTSWQSYNLKRVQVAEKLIDMQIN